MLSPLEQFDAVPLFNIFFHIFGYFFNVTFFHLLVPFLIFFFFFFIIEMILKLNLNLISGNIQYILDVLGSFILKMISQRFKSDEDKVLLSLFPFVFSLFLFILLSNYISLVPFGIALTSHLILIMWISMSLVLGIFFFGIYLHRFEFFKLFIPQCPFLMLPVLIIIEIFSYILRAFSLSLRLSANIMAGHTLVFIISAGLMQALNVSLWGAYIVFILLFLLFLLEFGVAFLQAYVFITLFLIYLFDAWHLDH